MTKKQLQLLLHLSWVIENDFPESVSIEHRQTAQRLRVEAQNEASELLRASTTTLGSKSEPGGGI